MNSTHLFSECPLLPVLAVSSYPPVSLVVSLLLSLIINIAIVGLLFLIVSHPVRRRRRIFELIEMLKLGLSSTGSMTSGLDMVVRSQDRSMDRFVMRFYKWLLASGHPSEFLNARRNLGWGYLPASIKGILSSCWGVVSDEKLVQLLENCASHSWSQGSAFQNRKQINLVPVLVISFLLLMIFSWFSLVILPRFNSIMSATMGGDDPMIHLSAFSTEFLRLASAYGHATFVPPVLVSVLACIIILYAGRGIFHRSFEPFSRFIEGHADRIIPYRRQLAEKDFAMNLCALLDAGIPESEAVDLACQSVSRPHWNQKRREAQSLMAGGSALPEVLDSVLEDPSLKWRFRNLLHSVSPRNPGLHGRLLPWAEMVSRKAAAAASMALDILLMGFIFLYGFIIAAMAFAIFDMLSAITISII